MNQRIFFYFVFLNDALISNVFGCVEFGKDNLGYCYFADNIGALNCGITNPLLEIKSINCSQHITRITIFLKTWDDLHTFLIDNQQSAVRIFNLYSNITKIIYMTSFSFTDLSLSSSSTDIVIDKNFIYNIPIHHLIRKQWIFFDFMANNWTNVNITVNNNIYTFKNIRFIISALVSHREVCRIKAWFNHRWYIDMLSWNCRYIFTLISSNSSDNSTAAAATIEFPLPKISQTTDRTWRLIIGPIIIFVIVVG